MQNLAMVFWGSEEKTFSATLLNSVEEVFLFVMVSERQRVDLPQVGPPVHHLLYLDAY